MTKFLQPTPDQAVVDDRWSDLAQIKEMPSINSERLHRYRMARLKSALRESGAAMCMLVSPVSLRYAIDYRLYSLFQSHIPTTYLFYSVEGPPVLCGGYDPCSPIKTQHPGRAINYFDGGPTLAEEADKLAEDIMQYLGKLGTHNRRVAIEYINPSITQALMRRGLEVIDGVEISERARIIKSQDEIECMKWSIGVAELGIGKIKQALRPGVSELQLWALLNYTNQANNGDWHDGRMLASGPRTNPWLQEASPRQIEAGDLLAFDTDMIGPFGYCADISRTLHCGPTKPTQAQKRLYRLANEEIEHNLNLLRPGLQFSEFQAASYDVPEEFHKEAYVCTIHGVGMCDEYPKLKPKFRGPLAYDGVLKVGMVICVESYMGAEGDHEGVKLEQQVLITEEGYEMLTTYPLEQSLLT